MLKRIMSYVIVIALFLIGLGIALRIIDKKTLFDYFSNQITSRKADGGICAYDNCDNKAAVRLEFSSYSKKDIKKFLKIKDDANFTITTDSFTYAPTKTNYYYDSGTYLVPQSDGSIKIESRSGWYEYQTKAAAETHEFVKMEGNYCSVHSRLAAETLQDELLNVYVKNRASKWLIISGCVLLPASVIVLVIAKKKEYVKV